MQLKRLCFYIGIFVHLGSYSSRAQLLPPPNAQHVEVILRMIGHQVLLSAGDSTSVVLPIVEYDGRYRIEFGSEFAFEPMQLVHAVNKTISETDLTDSYILEVESCDSGTVVYSFEVLEKLRSDIIPCGSRSMPKACYSLLISLPVDLVVVADEARSANPNLWALAILAILLIVGLILQRKRNAKTESSTSQVFIGKYLFDKRRNELYFKEQKIDLTTKERDLLVLLYESVNTTIEREHLLHKVWGDDGDYVGRTLDVFISKLRKKLELDPSLKIVNSRGIGYKLQMDV
jgi:DNA-binding winged helix-turn-helix (wHTH) protein